MTRPNSIEIGRSRLADDELDRLEERRAGAERVREQGDRVRKLLVERLEAAALAASEPHPRQEEAEHDPDEQGDRRPQRREAQREDDEEERDADDRGGPDREELAWLEFEVGTGDVAGEVRPEVALLDDPVERGERHALRDHLGDAAAGDIGRRILAGRVALEAVADRGAAAGRRNADGDQEDRRGRNPCDYQRNRIHRSASSPLST